jgi:beta-lactamase class A
MTECRATIDQASQGIGTFYVACRRLDAPGQYNLRDEDVVPIASMFKTLLALEVAEAFAKGTLRPETQVEVTPEQHTPGGLGLNQFSYPATVTLKDLLYLSLAWSDNTASDVLLALVGLDALHSRAETLGLETVRVVGDCRTLLRNAGEDFGYLSEAAAAEAEWVPTFDTADLVLERTTRASVGDLAQLGKLLALGRAASPQACAFVSELMQRQIWTYRFARSFPSSQWTRASKTGTLSPWRGELGVVTRRDGAQVAIAVVVRQHSASTVDEVVDSAVSAVASNAVELALAAG